VASDDITFILNFVKIGKLIPEFKERPPPTHTHTHTHTHTACSSRKPSVL
jgi:hypothetical protein